MRLLTLNSNSNAAFAEVPGHRNNEPGQELNLEFIRKLSTTHSTVDAIPTVLFIKSKYITYQAMKNNLAS